MEEAAAGRVGSEALETSPTPDLTPSRRLGGSPTSRPFDDHGADMLWQSSMAPAGQRCRHPGPTPFRPFLLLLMTSGGSEGESPDLEPPVFPPGSHFLVTLPQPLLHPLSLVNNKEPPGLTSDNGWAVGPAKCLLLLPAFIVG